MAIRSPNVTARRMARPPTATRIETVPPPAKATGTSVNRLAGEMAMATARN
jgi:hypothetical protein